MTADQMDQVFEAYHGAVYGLVTGQGGLRERLRGALAELRMCERFCVAWPAGSHDEKVAEDVPRLLEEGDRLDALTDVQMESLARGFWAAQRKVEAALSAWAAEQQEEMAG